MTMHRPVVLVLLPMEGAGGSTGNHFYTFPWATQVLIKSAIHYKVINLDTCHNCSKGDSMINLELKTLSILSNRQFLNKIVLLPQNRTDSTFTFYFSCFESNLNGEYYTDPKANGYYRGIIWELWLGDYSLKSARMMIR